MSVETKNLVILGSGPAGLTAALYASRSNLSPLVLEGMQPGGQLTTTSEVENFPGFPPETTGPQLILAMRKQAQSFGARLKTDAIIKVNFDDPKRLVLISQKNTYHTKSLIIATGAKARWLDFAGDKSKQEKLEKTYWGKGYTACATCDGAFYRDQVVGVVGGGDTACEEALFLTKFAKKIYLIHRRDELRASVILRDKTLQHAQIEPIWNSIVTNLHGTDKLSSITLQNTQNQQTHELQIGGLFAAIGHDPNTAFLGNILPKHSNGYLKVTNQVCSVIPSVFIAGDVSDYRYRQAVTAAGAGCMAALEAEKYLAEIS